MATALPASFPSSTPQQKARRQVVKALERQWRTIQTPAELQTALGADAAVVLPNIQAIAGGVGAVSELALAWKVRQQFLEDGLHVFTHAQSRDLGLGLIWAEELAAAVGAPIRSKERLSAPLRAAVSKEDATTLHQFNTKFSHIPQTGHYDHTPEISSQLLSVSTEFFNTAGGESALAYWRSQTRTYPGRTILESLQTMELSGPLSSHVQALIAQKINQSSVSTRVNDLVLVAMSKKEFEKSGYLSHPYGIARYSSPERELQAASVKVPDHLDRSDAQARLVARAIQTNPKIESWRLSSLSKVTRLNFRRDMAWLAAYAVWAKEHPTHPLLTFEEIQTRLCEDREFLKSHLARHGQFFKWLPIGLQKDVELLHIAAKTLPSVLKHVRKALWQEESLPALQFLMKEDPDLGALLLSDAEWVLKVAQQPEYEGSIKEWVLEKRSPLNGCPAHFFNDLKWVKKVLASRENRYQCLEEMLKIVKEDKGWVERLAQDSELRELFVSYLKEGLSANFEESQWGEVLKEKEIESAVKQGVREGRYSLASFPSRQRDPEWLKLAFHSIDRVERMRQFLKQLPSCVEWVQFAMREEGQLWLASLVQEAFDQDPTLFQKDPEAFFNHSRFHPLIKERLKRGVYDLKDLPKVAQSDLEWVEIALLNKPRERVEELKKFLESFEEEERRKWLAQFALHASLREVIKESLSASSFADLPEALRGYPEFIAAVDIEEAHHLINWRVLNQNPLLYIECLLRGKDLRPWMIYYEGWSDQVLYDPFLLALKEHEGLWQGKCHDLKGLYKELLTNTELLQKLTQATSFSFLVKLFAKTLSIDSWKELIKLYPLDHKGGVQLAASVALTYHSKHFGWWQRWRLKRRIALLEGKEAVQALQMAAEKGTLVEFFRCLPARRSRLAICFWEFTYYCKTHFNDAARAYFLHRWHPKLFRMPASLQKTFGQSPKALAKQPFATLQQLVIDHPWAAHAVLQALFFQLLPLLKTKQEKEAWRQRCFLQPPSSDLLEKFRQAQSIEALLEQFDR